MFALTLVLYFHTVKEYRIIMHLGFPLMHGSSTFTLFFSLPLRSNENTVLFTGESLICFLLLSSKGCPFPQIFLNFSPHNNC